MPAKRLTTYRDDRSEPGVGRRLKSPEQQLRELLGAERLSAPSPACDVPFPASSESSKRLDVELARVAGWSDVDVRTWDPRIEK